MSYWRLKLGMGWMLTGMLCRDISVQPRSPRAEGAVIAAPRDYKLPNISPFLPRNNYSGRFIFVYTLLSESVCLLGSVCKPCF